MTRTCIYFINARGHTGAWLGADIWEWSRCCFLHLCLRLFIKGLRHVQLSPRHRVGVERSAALVVFVVAVQFLCLGAVAAAGHVLAVGPGAAEPAHQTRVHTRPVRRAMTRTCISFVHAGGHFCDRLCADEGSWGGSRCGLVHLKRLGVAAPEEVPVGARAAGPCEASRSAGHVLDAGRTQGTHPSDGVGANRGRLGGAIADWSRRHGQYPRWRGQSHWPTAVQHDPVGGGAAGSRQAGISARPVGTAAAGVLLGGGIWGGGLGGHSLGVAAVQQ